MLDIVIHDSDHPTVEGDWGWSSYDTKEIWVKKDLPNLVKAHVTMHELYHVRDPIFDGYWKRELRANIYAFSAAPIGGVLSLILSLFTSYRRKFYFNLFKAKK
jgi:hypothetical protein